MTDERLEGFFIGIAFATAVIVISFLVCGSTHAATHAVTIEYADAPELAAKIDSVMNDSVLVNRQLVVCDTTINGKGFFYRYEYAKPRKFLQWIDSPDSTAEQWGPWTDMSTGQELPNLLQNTNSILWLYHKPAYRSRVEVTVFHRGILLYDDGEGK